MHEASLCAALLLLVQEEARRHRAERIVTVRLGVGVLAAVEARALAACFELLAEGTLAEGAKLVTDPVPAAAVCRACGRAFPLFRPRDVCPDCGGAALDVTGGLECTLTGLEAAGSEGR